MSQNRRTVADEPFLVLRTSASDVRPGTEVAEHAHDWHQLVHVRSGLVTVRTAAGTWLAPPLSAVWVPAGMRHALRFTSTSALRSAYLRPGWRDALPDAAGTVSVSPLLAALLARATAIGMLDRRLATEAAVAELIVAELGAVRPPAFTLPEPVAPTTAAAARLLDEGAPGIAAVARTLGTGQRTLERAFLAETGMPLGRWHQHRMLLRGLEHHAGGATVAAAAQVAGYRTASAYVAAFRAAFGVTPGRWLGPAEERAQASAGITSRSNSSMPDRS